MERKRRDLLVRKILSYLLENVLSIHVFIMKWTVMTINDKQIAKEQIAKWLNKAFESIQESWFTSSPHFVATCTCMVICLQHCFPYII